MGLFDTKKKQLESLQREVIANPTPQKMVDLVERYLRSGEEKRALDVARKAVERFPESELCLSSYQNIRKIQLQQQIQDLNRELQASATASVYERLATLYLNEMGNRTRAFEVVMKGLEAHPANDGLNLIAGRIRMARFHGEYQATDFNEAVNHLEQAVQGNDRNLRALICLAQMYGEAGMLRKALEYVEKAYALDPEVGVLKELQDLVEMKAQEGEDPFLDDLLMQIEEARTLSEEGLQILSIFDPSVRKRNRLQVSPSRMEQFLQQFQSMNGYKCSAVLTQSGEIVAGHSRGGIPREGFVDLSLHVMNSVMDAALKMDIGGFINGEFHTGVGRIRVTSWENLVFVFLADQPAKKDDIDNAVQQFQGFVTR